MSVDIKPSPNQRLSITLSAGSYILRTHLPSISSARSVISNAFMPCRLGVPYHSWRISHAKHHASTCHMTQDQVFVPASRKEMGLPDFKPAKEDLSGANVAQEVRQELWEALGDSPIATSIQCVIYLVSSILVRISNILRLISRLHSLRVFRCT